MKRHRSNTEQATDPITKMAKDLAELAAERSRGNKELLIALANAVADNERVQRRFRNAVLISLSRIDATVQMIHGAQIVETHIPKPGYEGKIREDAKDAEAFIAQRSHEIGLKWTKYVYEDPGGQRETRKARRAGPRRG